MKKLTVKDFLTYNNPCFGCKVNVNFYFTTTPKDPSKGKRPGYINPIVSTDLTIVDLIKSYSHSLELSISHKNNKFVGNNKHELESYLSDNSLALVLECPTCRSVIFSKKLEFDFKSQNIKPTEIRREIITIAEKERIYKLKTNMEKDTTHIEVYSNFSKEAWELDTPALPLYKFKNKNNIIKKIRVYMTFS